MRRAMFPDARFDTGCLTFARGIRLIHRPAHRLAQMADFEVQQRLPNRLQFLFTQLVDAFMHQRTQVFRIDVGKRAHGWIMPESTDRRNGNFADR